MLDGGTGAGARLEVGPGPKRPIMSSWTLLGGCAEVGGEDTLEGISGAESNSDIIKSWLLCTCPLNDGLVDDVKSSPPIRSTCISNKLDKFL